MARMGRCKAKHEEKCEYGEDVELHDVNGALYEILHAADTAPEEDPRPSFDKHGELAKN